MSTLVLAPLGGFLTYKSNKDSVVFNIDVYIAFFRKLLGIRQSRHIFKKEVIIHTPDYADVVNRLEAISGQCQDYANSISCWDLLITSRSSPTTNTTMQSGKSACKWKI